MFNWIQDLYNYYLGEEEINEREQAIQTFLQHNSINII